MEYATRAGATTSWYYGETEALLPKYAWYVTNSEEKAWPVGTLKPNDLGLFDMLGNAVEWCDDLQAQYERPLDSLVRTDWRGNSNFPKESDKCVIRGARATSTPDKLRAANRSFEWIDYHAPTTGFRVARTVRP
jgi:formylglycine-generating enzyme required for sulfatase activity